MENNQTLTVTTVTKLSKKDIIQLAQDLYMKISENKANEDEIYYKRLTQYEAKDVLFEETPYRLFKVGHDIHRNIYVGVNLITSETYKFLEDFEFTSVSSNNYEGCQIEDSEISFLDKMAYANKLLYKIKKDKESLGRFNAIISKREKSVLIDNTLFHLFEIGDHNKYNIYIGLNEENDELWMINEVIILVD